jgi:hypothetical protein
MPLEAQTRFHIAEVKSVELRPEHVALERQRIDYSLLLRSGDGIALHEIEREVRIPRGLRQSLLEVAQGLLRNKTVIGQHPGDTFGMMAGLNSSVRDEATASRSERSRTKWT